jgi:hypothetical protein
MIYKSAVYLSIYIGGAGPFTQLISELIPQI